MGDVVQKKNHKGVIKLLLQNEMVEVLGINKVKMKAMLEDGMPHYLVGAEKRFWEKEVLEWVKVYKPSQKRLEQEFRDKRGRTIEEYVSDELIQDTLRVSKTNLNKLCSTGMPYVAVGIAKYFNIEDILCYFRVGNSLEKGLQERKTIETKQKTKKELGLKIKTSKKGSCTILDNKNDVFKLVGNNVPKGTPLFIVDGSYNFKNGDVGTGVILINHSSIATGFTFVRNIKTKNTVICEYIAIMDALKIVKSESIKKAYIFTDQEQLVTGVIDINTTKQMKDSSISKYILELQQLFKELEDNIELKYVGNLKNGKKNPVFKKAHSLSRDYKNNIFKEIGFGS